MTEANPRSERTRIRLLNAACRLFAEKGFQNSTVAEICKQAHVNVASINYHFGDKERIYLEAWRYAFNRELAEFPAHGGVSEQAPAEQRLAGRIRSLLRRMSHANSYSFAIIHRELAQPTRLLADIMQQEIQPQRQQMIELLRDCLGEAADAQQVHFCHASIMGQCFQWLRLK